MHTQLETTELLAVSGGELTPYYPWCDYLPWLPECDGTPREPAYHYEPFLMAPL